MKTAYLIFAVAIVCLLIAAFIYESYIEAKEMPEDYEDHFDDTEF